MKYLILLAITLCTVSCRLFQDDIEDNSLSSWILENEREIDSATNSLVADFHRRNNIDGGRWLSSTIEINEYMPNILGKLASRAGDSAECIVLHISFYRDRNIKNRLLITASDSSCLTRLKAINLQDSSTDSFTFGVDKNPFIN